MYHDDMIRFAKGRLKQKRIPSYEIDAEDAVQNSFVKIIKYIDMINLSAPEKIKSYVYVAVPATILQFIIGEIGSYDGSKSLSSIINEQCHVTCEVTPSGSEFPAKFTIGNGLLKETVSSLPFTFDYYYGNNDTVLTGEKYCYGSWN